VTSSSTSPQPNLILIIVDALGAEDMSLYGYPLPTTPNLEKLTQDWTVYTHAYSTETCSIGVFPTLMTGRYPIYQSPYYRFGDLIRDSAEWVNLNQILQGNGYTTWWNGHMSAGFYHAGYGVQRTLFEPWNAPLVRAWFQFPGVLRKTFPYIPLNLHLAKSLHEPIGWYDALQDLRKEFASDTFQPPFFLYLHYGGVHGIPYRSGEFLGAFLPVESGLTDTSSQSSAYGAYAEDQQRLADQLRLRYNEAILNQDQELGRLIESIKGAGLYDSSMIILMADHGQNFKQGYTSHCTPLLSNSEAHVPLLIKYPHQTSGTRVGALVTTADITPTILDALGLHLQPQWFDGQSLLSTEEEALNDRLIFLRNSYEAAASSSFAVMSHQYKLVKRGMEYYLFDYLSDKEEEQNLLGSIDPAEEQRLQDALQSFIQRTK
jgi:arylsulfatase A-like enzyme